MGKRIYIGNLPWSVTKAKLEEIFGPFGEIEEALVIANKYTGRSRGFGFVTYKNDGDADKALKEMNEKEVEGRKLSVREARPLAQEEQGEKEKKESPEKEKKSTEEGKEEKKE